MNKEAFIAGMVKAAEPLGFFQGLWNTISSPLDDNVPGLRTWWNNDNKVYPINTEGKPEWAGFEHAAGALAREYPWIRSMLTSWQGLPDVAKWAIPLGGAALLGHGLLNGRGNNAPNITVNVPPMGGARPQQALFRSPTAMPGMQTA